MAYILMNNYMIFPKYDSFFNSIREFLVKTNLYSELDFIDVNDYDILFLENLIHIKFPEALVAFLKHFGKNDKILRPNLAMSLTDILNAFGKSSAIKEYLQKQNFVVNTDGIKIVNGKVELIKVTNGVYEEVINLNNLFDINEAIFLHVGFTTEVIDSRIENPIIHSFLSDWTFTSSQLRLTDFIRNILFNEIELNLKGRDYSSYSNDINSYYFELNKKINAIDISCLDWANTYRRIFLNNIMPVHEFRMYRNEFYFINEFDEIKKSLILSIDDFESAFIKYLQSKGFDIN